MPIDEVRPSGVSFDDTEVMEKVDPMPLRQALCGSMLEHLVAEATENLNDESGLLQQLE